MGEHEDRSLLDAALDGDARSLRALVERLVPTVRARVHHVLVRHGRRAQAAQVAPDLIQHVFLMLFEAEGRRLRAWEPSRGAALSTFVGLVAEREVVAILRRERRNPWTEAPTDGDELALHLGSAADQELEVADRDWLNVVLDKALAKLDDRGLLLFQRLVVDEAAVDTVARETGATLAALYMWKSRFARLVRAIERDLSTVAPAPSPRPSQAGLEPAWRAR
jgi:hypothetical protein